jgi:DNA-binding response OmpR family regulator/signal transduction histidine kinase
MRTLTKPIILLIEDNAQDAALVKHKLKKVAPSYQLETVASFFEGVEILQEQQIELVILDLTLPDIGGFKTLTKYLKSFSNIPVIVLTSTNNEIIGNQAIKAGAQDFLVKGQYDSKLLGRSIRYSLQRFKTQKKLEETAYNLKHSEKRFTEAQALANFGNWELDIVTNQMSWSDEIYSIFGFKPGGLQPSRSLYMDYVHPEDKSRVEQFFNDIIQAGGQNRLEHRIIVKGRVIKYIVLHAQVAFDEYKNLLLLKGVVQYIPEKSITEKLLVEKKMTDNFKMIQKEVFSNLSSQMRVPFTSILHFLFLLEQEPLSQQQRAYLNGVKSNFDSAYNSVLNVLNFTTAHSDQQEVTKEMFDMKELLKSMELISKFRAQQQGVGLEFIAEPEICTNIRGDIRKYGRVLFNLLDFAIYFTMEGMIEFRVQAGEAVPGPDQASFMQFEIQTGKTALPEEKVKEWENLNFLEVRDIVPSKLPAGAKELSLAVAKKLIEYLKGNISFQLKEDSTMVIHLSLPYYLIDKRPSSNHQMPTEPVHILLVEDHELSQIGTRRLLTTWSPLVKVDIASDGKEAIDLFDSNTYHLVLMDLQLKEMHGLEAGSIIRSKSDVPIIALSSNASTHEKEETFLKDMNDYLAKPFHPEELYEKIMQQLSGSDNQQ